MNLFTRTFSKIFKSSNQQELDKFQNLILAINDKENEIKSLSLILFFKTFSALSIVGISLILII